MPKTIIEKLWDAHVVHEQAGSPALMFIDLHLVHEVHCRRRRSTVCARGD